MSNYTHTNLRQDVPDSSEGSDREGSIEARFGRTALDAKQIGLSYFRYGPGFRAPFGHRHREQEEAYVIVGGSGRMKLDDEIIELRQWDAIRVAPEVARAFEGGPEGLELIAVGGPKPEGGDGEPAGSDFWPAE
jgi:mannose-6-phosphate isomerase-like protein (cupin superfamily)